MIDTYEFFKKYCDNKFKTPEHSNSILKSLARPELLAKEKELGKSFFEFSAQEMEDYLKNITTNRVFKGSGKPISPSYLGQLIAYYREIIFLYMKETGVYFENVLMDDRFTYSLAGQQNNDTPVFTKDTLERCCLALDEMFDPCEADYTKMILWLGYSGCFDYKDIFGIKEEDVDLDARTIRMGYRTIHMKDECYDLVLHHHDILEYKSYRMRNIMVPYHDSFVLVPIRVRSEDVESMNPIELREKYEAENNGRTYQRVTDIINKKLAALRKNQGIYISLDIVYYRGVFDYMIDRCGYDRAVTIIKSKGNRGSAEDYKEFVSILRDYGARCQDKSEIYRTKYNIETHFIR